MAEINNLIQLDWRGFGDFSAVGQLTQKIFSKVGGHNIYSIQTEFDGPKSMVSKVKDGKPQPLINWKIFQDAVVNEMKLIRGNKTLYVRLSPSLSTLELAVKLKLAIKELKIIVHYMDKPYLVECTKSKSRYIQKLYSFLIKNSDLFLTINESSVEELSNKYSITPKVLGNFVDLQVFSANKTKENVPENKYIATYFGSLDKKMNYNGVLDFCKAISGNKSVLFNIYTNSGLWGPLKKLIESSENISCRESKFSEPEYKALLVKSDFLVLPYNSDVSSSEFLLHSFSNKLVDYIESRTQVLVYGPPSIPTIRFCISNKFGRYFRNFDDLNKFFSNSKSLKDATQVSYSQSLMNFVHKSNSHVDEFTKCITKLDVIADPKLNNLVHNASEELINSHLGFLIKRKFFDAISGKQSLSASISAHMLKKYNYKGFDFEV